MVHEVGEEHLEVSRDSEEREEVDEGDVGDREVG